MKDFCFNNYKRKINELVNNTRHIATSFVIYYQEVKEKNLYSLLS